MRTIAEITKPDVQMIGPDPAGHPRPVPLAEVRRRFGLVSLADLSTGHMRLEQVSQFQAVLDGVREWRRQARQRPGLSAVLCSKQVGIGKTHIAQAVMASYSFIVCQDDETPAEWPDGSVNFSMEWLGRLFTARKLMDALGADEVTLPLLVPRRYRVVVLDDVGREGVLPYVKGDAQADEKRARYYRLVNHIYERRGTPWAAGLFITSNLTLDGLTEFLGEATWSRLCEMAPRGFMWQLSGLDDYRMIAGGR